MCCTALSLELRAGEIVAILGRNGMGKTTLIRSVAGLTPPRRGDIAVPRQLASPAGPPYAISQAGIAIVPQGRRIFRSLSVRENLALPTSALAGRSRAQAGAGPQALDARRGARGIPAACRAARQCGRLALAAASSRCSRSGAR